MEVRPSGEACGAVVTGIDLSRPLADAAVADIRAVWLEHHVLSFPDQKMSDDDLERFTLCFGPFGDDPFIAPIPGRKHIIAVKREANEAAPIFAENWHTDWSFQARPPAGTCLYGITIPPVGGDTHFANQHLALEKMPDALRAKLEGKVAIHSARVPYAKTGVYGEQDRKKRSMDIRASDEALTAEHRHPIIAKHPETGREGIYGCIGYITGFADMNETESMALLAELYAWQSCEEFVYKHKWRANMLVMWDNRSVLHRATGGYDGHARLLHRTTIGAR
ncbi:TauD/TfdA dioxygenase family protein [Hyphococcus sp.]|uniref:TauD/TfdA dioxygenase family protein n=1 Tax=Hyphococcus sp. TaxID=2038636 RepID=UPI0020838FA6|nr:MAG: taurine dioxygenase [Marinicaulis sp.]